MTDRALRACLPSEFHVSAGVRKKYGFGKGFFRSNGNVVFADFRAVREFAGKMNDRRAPGEKPVRAGELNAMGLIDEFAHQVFRTYEESGNPGCLRRAVAALEEMLGPAKFRSTLIAFTEEFPPAAVFSGDAGAAAYLTGTSAGRPHPEVVLEELLMLHLGNLNPAFGPFRELFDDRPIAGATSYRDLVTGLREILASAPPVRDAAAEGGGGGSILDLLEAPFRAHPENLSAQLIFIRDRWGAYLPGGFEGRIFSAEDLAREEGKEYPAGGTGDIVPPDYAAFAKHSPAEYPETEQFTHDTEWMPNVVLLAKNAYVWLDQLSKRHGRPVTRLDEVPDEELDRIARWNFTSLWLIGVWSRSPASEKIKRMTGNPEAAPSAYSVHEYEIAPDLGGERSFGDLAHRAWLRGIRLAADMVPNHTGLTSRWMREHPEYFVQSAFPPFPSYRFTGENLSDDPAYQVRIEDGYWNRTDAAVVFQRIDNGGGPARYIYHGNDGTNMPWNDTAQLDFLKSEVREAVIGQILHVAGKFSVIRFDAAMTLAKKHFHRLWYPRPGTGGDIPSRADHALSQEEFDAMFPVEFWREVVDRINAEKPQTLLLAEAFWLLEGYFVRTLGMHRVYNSAFMHMLMKEDNAMYREAIRNTLHFEPEILKRYVNFMSNPDEKTAVEQFGKGDKYFGVATLMVTLPGLPMFAHGQFEGLGEKYGMEYRRAYHDEAPDADLVARHEREIVPLLKLRHLFSQTAHFELYDVLDGQGQVIQDIFAYSNMSGEERAVVCVNNRYESYSGRLHVSAGKLAGPAGGGVSYRTIGEALKMRRDPDLYYTFREQRSGMEYVRPGADFLNDGMAVILSAFQSQVFLDFREVRDTDGRWGKLCRELGGAGVRDIDEEARAVPLRPFHESFARLLAPDALTAFARAPAGKKKGGRTGTEEIQKRFADVAAEFDRIVPVIPGRRKERERRFSEWLGKTSLAEGDPAVTIGWLAGSALLLSADGDGAGTAVDVVQHLDGLLIGRALGTAFRSHPDVPPGKGRKSLLVECLIVSGVCLRAADAPGLALRDILTAPPTMRYIGAHHHGGVEYFKKESFAELVSFWVLQSEPAGGGRKVASHTGAALEKRLLEGAERAGYRLREMAGILESPEFVTLTAAAVRRSAAPRRAGGSAGKTRTGTTGKTKKKN